MKELKHLNKYLWKYKWMLFMGFLFIVISNVFNVYSPGVIREAFDDISQWIDKYQAPGADQPNVLSQGISSALWFAGLYMIYALLKGLFLFFTRQTIIVTSRYIEYDLKNEVFEHYQVLPQAFYKRNNTGDLMNRISEDVSRVRMYLGPGIMYTVNLVVLFVMTIGMMISISPKLTFYTLAPLPLLTITIYYISNIINRKSEEVQAQQSILTTHAQEAFSGIRVIKTFGKELAIQDDFGRESELYKKKVLSLVKTDAMFFPIMTFLVGISTILAVYIGGLEVMAGNITKGNIAEFVIYVNMLTWPFASVGWVSSLVQRAAASQRRINEFLKTVPEIKNEKKVELHEIKGEICFSHVSFTYPDSEITALKDISFTIKPGKTLAIIGRTGSGKSTIAALMARLYDPTTGSVEIDGHKASEIDLNLLRSSLGYVPQEVFLFSDTISENIAFGLKEDEISNEKIHQAAKDAAIHENIQDFKQGYETVVGERGITLSGGQKQRVSIARAIIREPRILIFDDCLSAVDTETEDRILTNLKSIMKDRTSVIISHRVSSVKHADQILVLDKGEIIEQGTHTQLIDKKGVYFDLHRKQLLEEEKLP